MRNKQVIKIIIGCIAILIIALIATLIIYFSTDLLKPANQLFCKYFQRDVINVENILNLSNSLEYIDYLKTSNYNDNTQIKVSYTNSMQNQENFTAKITGTTDNQNRNSYRKMNISYGENANVSNIEFLQEKDIYGLLFADVVLQFASVDMSDKSTALERLHIDEKAINNFISKYKLKDIKTLIKDKRQDIENLIFNFLKDTDAKQFSSQKDRLITLSNGESVTTRLFSLKLTGEQTKRLVRDIFRELGDETTIDEIFSTENEFPQFNISLYTINGQSVRIDINFGQTIRLDIYSNSLYVEYKNGSETVEDEFNINMNVQNENNSQKIIYQDSKNNNIQAELLLNKTENGIESNINFDIKNNSINGLQISMLQQLESNANIQTEKQFSNVRNVILNNLSINVVNNAISDLFVRINERLGQVQNRNIHSELIDLWIKLNTQFSSKYQTIQENKENRFNNQFLMYKGENVEKNVVYNLIDIAGRNILNYEYNENNEIKIHIKEGNTDEDKVKELKKIVDKARSTYNISFEYDSEGKITVILLEQYKKEQ